MMIGDIIGAVLTVGLGIFAYNLGRSHEERDWVKKACKGAARLREAAEIEKDEHAALLCAFVDGRVRKAVEAEAERCRARRAIERGVVK